jgi:signal transduction histidine kinase/CheY-like chemotaxis protein
MVNLAAIVGITGGAIALLLAAFSLGMARSPFWAERRQFALVAAMAAGYSLFDVALVLDLPGEVIAASVQIALMFAVGHCIAWIRYLAAADQRPLRRAERGIVVIGIVVALAGFVPGLLLTRDLFTYRVEWLGITYRTPQPTLAGLACYGYLAAGLVIVAANARHRWREGWQGRLPLMGVFTLSVLAVNDTLSSAGVIAMPLLLDIASVGIVVIVAVVHERRFAANIHQLERASTELKLEVASRTQALLDAQAALAASERLAGLGRLTAGVAHEINNPIAVVRHSLERIRDGGRDDTGSPVDVCRHIDNGLAATDRVVRIVRRLLDAGRVGHTDTAHAEPFRVVPVVTQAIAMVGRHLKTLNVSVAADAGLTALGDAGFVSQVLENLLVNAAHAFEDRPETGRIEVRAERFERVVRITVTDNGPGMPAEVQAKLFEPFVTTKVIGKGSGLGLAVSKGLMRSQHGDLVLVRTSDTGTQMALTLPWTPLEPPAPVLGPELPDSPANLSILIIDDEPDVREMLVDACSSVFTAIAVSSVTDGLAQIEDGLEPDVVLCDLMMPDGGAYEWLQQCELRCSPLAGRTVIITGGPATAQDEALLAANADRVLLKPFSLVQLRAMVTRTIENASTPSP